VKAKNRPLCHADSIARNGVQHKRTRGETRPVNDNSLARPSELGEEVKYGPTAPPELEMIRTSAEAELMRLSDKAT
jgi:hypothetical protein